MQARGQAQEGVLGSVNSYLHYHSRVPILSVPDQGGANPCPS